MRRFWAANSINDNKQRPFVIWWYQTGEHWDMAEHWASPRGNDRTDPGDAAASEQTSLKALPRDEGRKSGGSEVPSDPRTQLVYSAVPKATVRCCFCCQRSGSPRFAVAAPG